MKCTAMALALGALLCPAAYPKVFSEVLVYPSFFNPSLGQKETIRGRVSWQGTLRATILDRDRFSVRSLEPIQVTPGEFKLQWDGKDQAGEVVPDEAYSLRLEISGPDAVEVYDPSEHYQPLPEEPKINFYSRQDGVLSYTLARPSRVHAQAGQARTDPVTKQRTEVVLKTLVDDAPRVTGPVVEKWNGIDEGGTISVPNLPDFVVAVLATPLPASSMIAVGNRKETFFAHAVRHRPAAATKPRDLRASTSRHHSGLTALEDQTPPLELKPSAAWNSRTRGWEAGLPLRVMVTITGEGASYFLSQPTELSVLVDGRETLHLQHPESPANIELPAGKLGQGPHQIAFNWISRLGPVAVNAMSVAINEGRVGKSAKETQ